MEPEIKLPPRISFKVCNNTPWMLKGADTSCLEQLNGKALRGVMRFWFRALYYGAGEAFPGYSINGDLQKLNVLENFLFGGQRNRGLVNIVVKKIGEKPDLWPEYKSLVTNSNDKGLYIGYHATHKGGKNDKPGITKNLNKRYEWSVDFIFNHLFGERGGDLSIKSDSQRLSAEELLYNKVASFYVDKPQKLYSMILDSFEALLLFGGMGSRSRKGFGSLELLQGPVGQNLLDKRDWPYSGIAHSKILEGDCNIKRLVKIGNSFKGLPEISAFSSMGTLGFMLLPAESSYKLMEKFNYFYLIHRKWNQGKLPQHHAGGHKDGKLDTALIDFGERAVRNGGQVLETAIKTNLKRYCLGLPLTFPKTFAGMKTEPGEVFFSEGERRASPLFFSVIKVKGGYLGILTYLFSKFVPDDRLVFEYGGRKMGFEHNCLVEREYINSIISCASAKFEMGKIV